MELYNAMDGTFFYVFRTKLIIGLRVQNSTTAIVST